MPVADLPIIEIVVRQLVRNGFPQITISLGHLAGLIMAVVGDGHSWGADVEYVREERALGTIGPVALVPNLDEPFLVMNGDLLTDFNYRHFMDSHIASGAQLSVGVYQKEIPVSLGVFQLDDANHVTGFREKPTLSFPCSMGIYAFNPELIGLIPQGAHFGFDDLVPACMEQNIAVRAHTHDGIWLDIGRPEDYETATTLLHENWEQLLPGTPIELASS
jgi:NDP-sugar pyrophosphorylase family protein